MIQAHPIRLRWTNDVTTLPYLMGWKMIGQSAYVVGIEPANCRSLADRGASQDSEQLPISEPGDSSNYAIGLEVVS